MDLSDGRVLLVHYGSGLHEQQSRWIVEGVEKEVDISHWFLAIIGPFSEGVSQSNRTQIHDLDQAQSFILSLINSKCCDSHISLLSKLRVVTISDFLADRSSRSLDSHRVQPSHQFFKTCTVKYQLYNRTEQICLLLIRNTHQMNVFILFVRICLQQFSCQTPKPE